MDAIFLLIFKRIAFYSLIRFRSFFRCWTAANTAASIERIARANSRRAVNTARVHLDSPFTHALCGFQIGTGSCDCIFRVVLFGQSSVFRSVYSTSFRRFSSYVFVVRTLHNIVLHHDIIYYCHRLIKLPS